MIGADDNERELEWHQLGVGGITRVSTTVIRQNRQVVINSQREVR
jgi:hypothetical protein